MNQRSTTDDGDRRFTLPDTLAKCLELAREHAGADSFDLDPCADALAKAAPDAFYTDGLDRPWHGEVFVNPPWSDIGPWVSKAWVEVEEGHCKNVTMLLPDNRQSTAWWQELVEPHRDGRCELIASTLTTHYLKGRPRYGSPSDPQGLKAQSPPFGAVVLIWSRS